MKLDRNANEDGKGKYALIKLREAELQEGMSTNCTPVVTVPLSAVDFGCTPDSEFFVIRLRDKHAGVALCAYAMSAQAS